VRAGDGEGNCLFFYMRRAEYPGLSSVCMNRIWNLMFGNSYREDADFAAVSRSISDAVMSADYLGIHTDLQTRKALSEIERNPSFDIRGMTGVLAVRDYVYSHRELILQNGSTITSCHSHKQIPFFFKRLAKSAGNLSVISCYSEALTALHRVCGV